MIEGGPGELAQRQTGRSDVNAGLGAGAQHETQPAVAGPVRREPKIDAVKPRVLGYEGLSNRVALCNDGRRPGRHADLVMVNEVCAAGEQDQKSYQKQQSWQPRYPSSFLGHESTF